MKASPGDLAGQVENTCWAVMEGMDYFDILNAVYKPLCDKAVEISREIRNAGYQATVQFHNNHSVKRNNGFAIEYFPIPVITIDKLGDIGVDIDSVWFEAVLTKEQAVKVDYAKITNSYRVEVYGNENFLHDLYNEQIDVSNIADNIANCPDKHICILIYLDSNVAGNELIKVARLIAV